MKINILRLAEWPGPKWDTKKINSKLRNNIIVPFRVSEDSNRNK